MDEDNYDKYIKTFKEYGAKLEQNRDHLTKYVQKYNLKVDNHDKVSPIIEKYRNRNEAPDVKRRSDAEDHDGFREEKLGTEKLNKSPIKISKEQKILEDIENLGAVYERIRSKYNFDIKSENIEKYIIKEGEKKKSPVKDIPNAEAIITKLKNKIKLEESPDKTSFQAEINMNNGEEFSLEKRINQIKKNFKPNNEIKGGIKEATPLDKRNDINPFVVEKLKSNKIISPSKKFAESESTGNNNTEEKIKPVTKPEKIKRVTKPEKKQKPPNIGKGLLEEDNIEIAENFSSCNPDKIKQNLKKLRETYSKSFKTASMPKRNEHNILVQDLPKIQPRSPSPIERFNHSDNYISNDELDGFEKTPEQLSAKNLIPVSEEKTPPLQKYPDLSNLSISPYNSVFRSNKEEKKEELRADGSWKKKIVFEPTNQSNLSYSRSFDIGSKAPYESNSRFQGSERIADPFLDKYKREALELQDELVFWKNRQKEISSME